jgi:hypothetical protein
MEPDESKLAKAKAEKEKAEKEKAEKEKTLKDKVEKDVLERSKDPTKKLAHLMKEAGRVKTKFTQTLLRARELAEQIPSDQKFEWARNNPKGDHMIQGEMKALKEHLTEFHREFLLAKDLNVIKKKNSVEAMTLELASLVAMEQQIGHLAAKIDRFLEATELMNK